MKLTLSQKLVLITQLSTSRYYSNKSINDRNATLTKNTEIDIIDILHIARVGLHEISADLILFRVKQPNMSNLVRIPEQFITREVVNIALASSDSPEFEFIHAPVSIKNDIRLIMSLLDKTNPNKNEVIMSSVSNAFYPYSKVLEDLTTNHKSFDILADFLKILTNFYHPIHSTTKSVDVNFHFH